MLIFTFFDVVLLNDVRLLLTSDSKVILVINIKIAQKSTKKQSQNSRDIQPEIQKNKNKKGKTEQKQTIKNLKTKS